MADLDSGLMKLLELGAPLGVAFYSTDDERREFIERTKILAEPKPVRIVQSGGDALKALIDDVVVLVVPDDEAEAVEFLDRNREQVLAACRPVLLFLEREGPGKCALATAPALVSVVRDMAFDLSREISQDAAATAFRTRHGVSHLAWLSQWRSGVLPDTLDNNLMLSEALAIGEIR